MRNAHPPSRWTPDRIWLKVASLLWAIVLLAALPLMTLPHQATAGGGHSNAAVMSAFGQQFSAIQALGSAGGTWLLHNEGLRLDVSRCHVAQLDNVFRKWLEQPLERRVTPSSKLKQLSKTIRSRAQHIETKNDVDFYEIHTELMAAQFMFRDNCIQSAIIAVRQDDSHWTVFTASAAATTGSEEPLDWQAFSGNTVASRLDPSGQVVAKVVTTQHDARMIFATYIQQGWEQEIAGGQSVRQTDPLVFRRGTSVVTVAASSIPRTENLVLLIKGNSL